MSTLTELFTEYAGLHHSTTIAETANTKKAALELAERTGHDGDAFVNSVMLHTLDQMEIIAAQISFAKPASKDEAIALLTFATLQENEAKEHADQPAMHERLTRLAERCRINAHRYLESKVSNDLGDVFPVIRGMLKPHEPHDPDAVALVFSARSHG